MLQIRKFSLKFLFILCYVLILEIGKIVKMVGFKQGVTWQRWSLPVCRLNIRQDSEVATGYGYPKTAFKREPDMDPDIQKLLSNENRIRIRISETLLSIFSGIRLLEKLRIAQSFTYYAQKHLVSLLCHDFQFVYGVISALQCNPIPPLNLLTGNSKFVSMNLFLVWQDRALSVYILRTLFAAYLDKG